MLLLRTFEKMIARIILSWEEWKGNYKALSQLARLTIIRKPFNNINLIFFHCWFGFDNWSHYWTVFYFREPIPKIGYRFRNRFMALEFRDSTGRTLLCDAVVLSFHIYDSLAPFSSFSSKSSNFHQVYSETSSSLRISSTLFASSQLFILDYRKGYLLNFNDKWQNILSVILFYQSLHWTKFKDTSKINQSFIIFISLHANSWN